MTPRAPILETDIGRAVVQHLTAHGFSCAEDRKVVLNGQQVSVDIIGRKAEEIGDWYIVIECKASLNDEVIEQAARWGGLANEVYVAVTEPRGQSKTHKARRVECHRRGVGVVYVSESSVVTQVQASIWDSASDTRKLAEAFDSAPIGSDPPAGSAGVKRNGAALQGIGYLIAQHLSDNGPCGWKDIPKYLTRGMTAAAARKLIVRGEWPMLKEEGFPRSVFRAVEVLAK